MNESGHRARLLVVEDDAGLRYVLVRTLQRAGYEVREAGTGAEALAQVEAAPVDLVLLDMALPDTDGAQVRRALKERPGRAPLVVHLTGVATSADRMADALEEGADGYLTKPVPERSLLAHVGALLRLRDAEAALVAQQTEELRALVAAAGEAPAPTEANREVGDASNAWQALAARYGELLDWAVEQRGFSVNRPLIAGVRELSASAAAEGCGAREVVQLHARALEARTTGLLPARAQVVVEEGRLLLVHLLGELVNRYRAAGAGAAETK